MKKIIVLTLVLLLSIAVPTSAIASGNDDAVSGNNKHITVYAAIAIAGEFARSSDGTPVAGTAVEVSDFNEDGSFTLEDAFTAIHAALCPDGAEAFASYESQYGLSISKLWGDESGAFGYYVNNMSAMSVADPISDGDFVTAFVYSDTTNFSDMYTWFENSDVKASAGENVTLALKGYAYDESWNLLEVSCGDAAITVLNKDGSESNISSVIDEDGLVSISFPEAGTYTVTAKTADTVIVPAYCTVTVEKGNQEDKADSSSNSSQAENNTNNNDNTANGENNDTNTIIIWSLLGVAAAVIVFIVIRRKASKR